MEINNIMESIKPLLSQYGPGLIKAAVTLIIGLWVIGFISKSIRKLLDKKDFDATLKPFIITLINTLLKAMLIISVLGMMGVEMTSFVAILGAAGLAVGLALSGTLQNFAGGVMILIFKPFKAGDFIEAQGYSGTVSEIRIFNTFLKTPDNKVIIIPNGGLSTGSLTNYSSEPLRRVDWTFGIGYGDDVDQAKACILELLKGDDRIHNDPEPFIAVSALADSSVNIVVRVWVNSGDYWAVFFRMNELVYKTFPQKGLSIPFPQMDVHVHNN